VSERPIYKAFKAFCGRFYAENVKKYQKISNRASLVFIAFQGSQAAQRPKTLYKKNFQKFFALFSGVSGRISKKIKKRVEIVKNCGIMTP
jgi:hypothetical protein